MILAEAAGVVPVEELQPRSTGIKRFLPKTLFARALLIIVTPLVLAQMVATYIFYDRHWESTTYRMVYAIAGETAMLIEQLDRDRTPAAREHTLDMAERATDLIITFYPGQRLAKPAPKEMDFLQRVMVTLFEEKITLEQMLTYALSKKVTLLFAVDTEYAYKWYEVRLQAEHGVLSVVFPKSRVYTPTSYIFILWMLGSSLILFTIAIIFMRNQIRPIRRLAQAADSFGKGRDVTDFKLEGASEVRQAAAAFLVMRARIKRQIAQRTAMLAGVSHDLRTPLTRMKLELAMMGDGEAIEELRRDLGEMEAMLDGYLAFARGEGTEAVVPTDLNALVSEVVNSVRRAGGNVFLDLEDGLHLPLRVSAFKRCLNNLLANARRHATRVWVTGRRVSQVIEILIDDDGPGIPAEAREEVFKPFYRLDVSRNVETGGAGLGLTIARDVVRGLGGDLTLHDSPSGGGLRAQIRLPL